MGREGVRFARIPAEDGSPMTGLEVNADPPSRSLKGGADPFPELTPPDFPAWNAMSYSGHPTSIAQTQALSSSNILCQGNFLATPRLWMG